MLADKKNFYWSKLFNKSNIHLSVLSFNKDYVDENIGIDNLQKELTTKILPMFLKQCGYQDPYKTMDWVVSLHKAFDRNNYHFHIGFIEKKEYEVLKTLQLLSDNFEFCTFNRKANQT